MYTGLLGAISRYIYRTVKLWVLAGWPSAWLECWLTDPGPMCGGERWGVGCEHRDSRSAGCGLASCYTKIFLKIWWGVTQGRRYYWFIKKTRAGKSHANVPLRTSSIFAPLHHPKYLLLHVWKQNKKVFSCIRNICFQGHFARGWFGLVATRACTIRVIK